jgi:bifunctional UDP-N-acetylglucosamine pyrophosphorylase/glucosamine-1-phosphate N-acetyltransferase
VLIKNQDDYLDNYSTSDTGRGIVTAKYAGDLGNTLRVSICASSAAYSSNLTVTDSIRSNAVASGETTININGSANAAANLQSGDLVSVDGGTTYIRVASVNATAIIVASAPGVVAAGVPILRKWQYADQFGVAPGTSDYATAAGGSNDEMHVIVVDEDGKFSNGVANTVLEKFAFVSKASDAKFGDRFGVRGLEMIPFSTVILAAGEGTRMRSALPKVLHDVGGLPLVGHVLKAAQGAGSAQITVVIGPEHDAVATLVSGLDPAARFVKQTERLGTGHAVRMARASFDQSPDPVVVLLGDAPLISAATVAAMIDQLAHGADIAVVGFEAADPTGYGRLLTEGDTLLAIREHKDASHAERAITLCNSGVIGFGAGVLTRLIDRIGNANAKGEYYLTDAIELAQADGGRVTYTIAPEAEVQGVNDRAQLARAEAQFQALRRDDWMAAGVTLKDPTTVYFSFDTALGRDVVIEPHVVFGPGVVVEEGAVIHAFSHIEGAHVGPGASVGPFARLRPGADLGPHAKVGNFVEVKNAQIGAGAKLPHLSYVGDAKIGARANLGAGTITCNYDGVNKFETVVGADAFIGSNSSLVAPVTIGEGAYVGSGSVITRDVEPGALALGRARQDNKPGYAARIRARAEALKKARKG